MSPGRPRSLFFPRDDYFMRLALREAERSIEHGDVPVGCVIAKDGEGGRSLANERDCARTRPPTARCSRCARPPRRPAPGG